jgi:hypothetical protein
LVSDIARAISEVAAPLLFDGCRDLAHARDRFIDIIDGRGAFPVAATH